MKKIRALTAALVAVIVLVVAGGGALGCLLYDSRQENARLADQMNFQEASMQAEIDSLNGEISALEAQVETLEAQLAAKSTVSTSSTSGGSTSSASSDTQSVTVYITRTGEKYHRSGCQYLRQSKIPIELATAKARGYTACSVCF